MARSPGKFITFEGGEGAGKSTQVRRLADFLSTKGISIELTREPGGSAGAEEIRKLLVEGDVDRWDPISETLLLMAARRSHLKNTIIPALSQGTWVLCDRFADSTLAYQGFGQGVDFEFIEGLTATVADGRLPDLTILMDIPVEIGLERALARGEAARYERMERSMHNRIRAGFLELARKHADRYEVIDATRSIEDIEAEIKNCIVRHFGLK